MAVKNYDPDARCPKCGYDCVTTKYEPARYFTSHTYPLFRLDPPWPERLVRTCVRCGHQWAENVITVHEIDVRSTDEDSSECLS
jgi:hypothetical protein